jgi:copper(I)-binding protein
MIVKPLLLLPLFATLAACGAATKAPNIQPGDAWARPAGGGQNSTAAYFTITNGGGPDALTTVSTPVGTASLHSMTMDGGIMRMRPMTSLEIDSGATVQLRPGGNHVMITNLKGPLAAGQSFPLKLAFRRSGEQTVTVTVRNAGASM